MVGIRGGAQPLSLNLLTFLPNADKIAENLGKSEKPIDNSLDSDIIVCEGIVSKKVVSVRIESIRDGP